MFMKTLGANSMIMVNLLRQHAAACYSQDRYSEGEGFLREAIAKAKMQASSETQQISFVIKQGLHLELASNLEEQGRYRDAKFLHKQAVGLLRESRGHLSLRADHCISLAALLRRQCKYSEAAEVLQQAQADCIGNEEQMCRVLLQQSKVANDTGDKEEALQLMLSVQSRVHKCNPNSKYRAFFLCEDLGWVYFHRREWHAALHWLDRAVAIVKRLAAGSCQANFQRSICYAGAAAVRFRLGEALDHAIEYQSIAAECLKAYGCYGTNGVQRALFYLGICHHLQGEHELANGHFEKAVQSQRRVYHTAHPSSAIFMDPTRSL
ncbi:hypothetical protein WJX77_002059 [Trebouxia sp. C0004]